MYIIVFLKIHTHTHTEHIILIFTFSAHKYAVKEILQNSCYMVNEPIYKEYLILAKMNNFLEVE